MNRPIGRDEAVPALSAGDDPGTFQRPLSAMLGLPLAAFAIAVALGTPLLGRPSLVEPVTAAFGVLAIWMFTLNLGVRRKPTVVAEAGLDGDAGVGAAVAIAPRHTLPERLVFAARNGAAVAALLMLAAPVMMFVFVGISFVLSLISACSAEAAIWLEVHASSGGGDGDGDGGDGGGDGGGD